MTRIIGLILLLLLGGSAFAQSVPPTGCTTTTCTGTVLPLGNLIVAGNQLQSGPGNNVRLACTVYRGTGGLPDFQAIRAAGFNCARIDWRDAYLSAASPPAGCNSLTQIQACVANAKTAGLAVIFSHLGNEIPAAGSSCVFRQANGLWFDSGPDSGGADGCGDTGTVTAATFQTNTVNLLGAFNGNSAVVGYELHNEPLVSGTFTGTGGGGGSGRFTVVNGQIFDPNGAVFIARGYAVTIGDALQGNSGPVSVSNIQRLFPRTNYIRIWGTYNEWTPSALSPWITALNNLGIVVSVEDYTGNGLCRTGSDLAQANAWYATAAAFYKTDAYVWFESQNECFNPAGSDSLNQITTNYNSVRSNSAFAMFGIGSSGGSPDPANGQWYFTNIAFKPMSNIFFDIHPYAGAYTGAGVPATQAAYDAQLRSWVQTYLTWTTDAEPVIPVISGEIGNCGGTPQCNSNNTPEPTGPLAVKAAADVASVTGGTAAGASAGVGYWQWGDDGDASNVDTLVISGSATNPYGIQVQGLIASMPGTGPTPAGATGIPPINWGGGGPTDIRLACSTVGAAVFAVNPGVVQFCPGPVNNTGTTLLNGTPKP